MGKKASNDKVQKVTTCDLIISRVWNRLSDIYRNADNVKDFRKFLFKTLLLLLIAATRERRLKYNFYIKLLPWPWWGRNWNDKVQKHPRIIITSITVQGRIPVVRDAGKSAQKIINDVNPTRIRSHSIQCAFDHASCRTRKTLLSLVSWEKILK